MPEEKNFKRRVRARAAETGERYTQARAALDVRASDATAPTPDRQDWTRFGNDWVVHLRLGGPWQEVHDAMPTAENLELIARLTLGAASVSAASHQAVMQQRVESGLSAEDLNGTDVPRVMDQRKAAFRVLGSLVKQGVGLGSQRFWSGDPVPDTDPPRFRQHEVGFDIGISDELPRVLAHAEARTELPWLLDLCVEIPTDAEGLELIVREAPEQLRWGMRELALAELPMRLVYATSRPVDSGASADLSGLPAPHERERRPRPAELLSPREIAQYLKCDVALLWDPAHSGTSEDGPYTSALYEIDDDWLSVTIYGGDTTEAGYADHFRNLSDENGGRYQQMPFVADDAYVDGSGRAVCMRVGTMAAVIAVNGEGDTNSEDLVSLARLMATRLRDPGRG